MSLSVPKTIACLLVILAVEAFPQIATGAENTGTIVGVVKKASGEAAAGAFVKLRNPERKLTFMVVSQNQGQFQLDKLPPGKYQVIGIGGGMQSDPMTTNLERDKPATVDLILNKPQPDASKALLPSDYGTISAWNSHLPKSWPDGPVAKYVVVELALAVGADPHDVAADSKGIGWVDERRLGIIGRFDPQTFSYTRIRVPAGKNSSFYANNKIPSVKEPEDFGLNAIDVDPQDRVWAIDGANQRLVQYNPKTQEFKFFAIPDPPHKGDKPFNFNTIRFHPDGSVWGTLVSGNQIVRVDPSGKVTFFEIPSGLKAKEDAHPYGMAIDGNGKVWFSEITGKKVGKVDPVTGSVTEYDLPFPDAAPRRMTADTEGNVWLCLGIGDWAQEGRLTRIDRSTSQFTHYDPPAPKSGPTSPDVDRKHNVVWFMEMPADKLTRFDPRTKTFSEYSLATRHSKVRRIEVDRSHPSRIWFSGNYSQGNGYDKIGYIDVLE